MHFIIHFSFLDSLIKDVQRRLLFHLKKGINPTFYLVYQIRQSSIINLNITIGQYDFRSMNG